MSRACPERGRRECAEEPVYLPLWRRRPRPRPNTPEALSLPFDKFQVCRLDPSRPSPTVVTVAAQLNRPTSPVAALQMLSAELLRTSMCCRLAGSRSRTTLAPPHP